MRACASGTSSEEQSGFLASVRLGFHIGVAPLPPRAEEREIGGLLVGMPGDLLEVKRQAQAGTLGDAI